MKMNEKEFISSVLKNGIKESVKSIHGVTSSLSERNDLISKIPFVYGLAMLSNMITFVATPKEDGVTFAFHKLEEC